MYIFITKALRRKARELQVYLVTKAYIGVQYIGLQFVPADRSDPAVDGWCDVIKWFSSLFSLCGTNTRSHAGALQGRGRRGRVGKGRLGQRAEVGPCGRGGWASGRRLGQRAEVGLCGRRARWAGQVNPQCKAFNLRATVGAQVTLRS